jgi:transposase-like protein
LVHYCTAADKCDGKYFKPHQQNCIKPLQDTEYDTVNVKRWRCLKCEKTFRVYPEGVSGAQRSDRLKGANVLLYLLGLSYGGVEDFMTALGHPVGKTTVYRDVQAAGKKARNLRNGWLIKSAGGVRIVGGDPTHVKCQGEDVIVGVTVDAEEGMTLDICILENEQAETLTDWLKPMMELTGAEVLITDDADGMKIAADEAGVHHQLCRQHTTPNLLDFIAKAANKVLTKPPKVPAGLEISIDQFLADLMVLEWIMLGHPGHGEKLLGELYMRYAAAPAPKKGKRASIWYRMRNQILHLWKNWKRLTCYRDLKHTQDLEVDETNNCSERAIGWAVKERYRTMRGYKRKESILNVAGLTAWLFDQPDYRCSPDLVDR